MAKTTVRQNQPSSLTSKFAFGIAALALIIALVAWNNTTQNQEAQKLQGQVQSLKQQAQLEKIGQQLDRIRQDIATGTSSEVVQQEITVVRRDIQTSLQTADAKSQIYLKDLDQSLVQLQQEVKLQSINALTTLDGIIVKLKLQLMRSAY